jgi:hypothetical protein
MTIDRYEFNFYRTIERSKDLILYEKESIDCHYSDLTKILEKSLFVISISLFISLAQIILFSLHLSKDAFFRSSIRLNKISQMILFLDDFFSRTFLDDYFFFRVFFNSICRRIIISSCRILVIVINLSC